MAPNKLPTLTLCKGLPGSGKSTWARDQAERGKAVRINKDDLRNMLHNGRYSKPNEKQVRAIQNLSIELLLDQGVDVIVDDTNLNPTTVHHFIESFSDRSKIKFKDFMDVPVEECIKRDSQREGKANVGPKVILGMYEQYRPMTAKRDCTIVESVTDLNLPDTVLVDIDGTLAHHDKKRSPFDWKQVINDRPDNTIIALVKQLVQFNYIIVLSGRDSVCRPETEAWLKQYDVPYHKLFMRTEGDQRKDSIIKQEIYESNIKGKYDVKFVLDDRNQVVDMWRSIGIKCLQCEPGAF